MINSINKLHIVNNAKKDCKMVYVTRILILTATIILSLSFNGEIAVAGDFDDGISTYKDDSIESDAKMGDPEVNINFIVLDAISSAKRGMDNENVNISDGSGSSNKNSVVCEVGSDCSGPIYNIDLD